MRTARKRKMVADATALRRGNVRSTFFFMYYKSYNKSYNGTKHNYKVE